MPGIIHAAPNIGELVEVVTEGWNDPSVELPFEINIFKYSFVNHVQLDIRIWNLEIRMCHKIRISRLIRI